MKGKSKKMMVKFQVEIFGQAPKNFDGYAFKEEFLVNVVATRKLIKYVAENFKKADGKK